MQPVRHFEEGHIDVYIFICYLAYLAIALYKNQINSNGWEGVREGLEEMGESEKQFSLLGKKNRKAYSFHQRTKRDFEKIGSGRGTF